MMRLIDQIRIQDFYQTEFGLEFHHVTPWKEGTYTAVVENGFLHNNEKYFPGQRVYFNTNFKLIPKP